MDPLQIQESQKIILLPDQQQQDTNIIKNVQDHSETVTLQNESELSDETHNPQRFTVTIDLNIIQIPVHNITHDTTADQNQDNIPQNTNQDNNSILSTSNTNITQPFQTQQPSPQNYDPPPLPPQYSTETTPHNSPQQSSSNTETMNTVQFHTTTSTTQPTVQTLSFTPAQNTQSQNVQNALTNITLHSNAIPNYTTSRNLSGPPLQTIPTNPLSYSHTSTNPNNTHHPTTNNNHSDTLNPFPPSQTSNN